MSEYQIYIVLDKISIRQGGKENHVLPISMVMDIIESNMNRDGITNVKITHQLGETKYTIGLLVSDPEGLIYKENLLVKLFHTNYMVESNVTIEISDKEEWSHNETQKLMMGRKKYRVTFNVNIFYEHQNKLYTMEKGYSVKDQNRYH